MNPSFAKWFPWISRRRDVRLTIWGMIGGGIIGAIVTHLYYLKSLTDLEADAAERKREVQLILRGIESGGTIKYHRDAHGNVTGVVIELAASVKGTGTVSGSLP